jgi:hypothetical protein
MITSRRSITKLHFGFRVQLSASEFRALEESPSCGGRARFRGQSGNSSSNGFGSTAAESAPCGPKRASRRSSRSAYQKVPQKRDVKSGSGGARTRDLRRDRAGSRLLPSSAAGGRCPTGERATGCWERVGETTRQPRNRLTKPSSRPGRVDIASRRSPAGSSPASSIAHLRRFWLYGPLRGAA